MDAIQHSRYLLSGILSLSSYRYADKTIVKKVAELHDILFSTTFLLQNLRLLRLDVNISPADLENFTNFKESKAFFAVSSFVRNGYVRERALDVMADHLHDPLLFPFILLRVADPFKLISTKAAGYAAYYLKDKFVLSFLKNYNVLQYILQSGYSNATYIEAVSNLLLLPQNIELFWDNIALFNDAERHFFYSFLISKNKIDTRIIDHAFDKNYDKSIFLVLKNIGLFPEKQAIIDKILAKISSFSNKVRFQCYKLFQTLQVPTNQIVKTLLNDNYAETKLFLLGNINSFAENRMLFLTKYIKDSSKRVQRNALYLVKFSEVPHFKLEIQQGIYSPDFYIRDWCRTLLGSEKLDFASLYRNKLQTAPTKGCIFGLSECGEKSDIPLFLDIIKNYNDNLRAYAITALSRYDVNMSKNIAFDNLENEQSVVKNTAIKTLLKFVRADDLRKINKIADLDLKSKLFAKLNIIRSKK